MFRDFPSRLGVKTLPSNAEGSGSILGQGTKIPHAVGCGQKLKTKTTIYKEPCTPQETENLYDHKYTLKGNPSIICNSNKEKI